MKPIVNKASLILSAISILLFPAQFSILINLLWNFRQLPDIIVLSVIITTLILWLALSITFSVYNYKRTGKGEFFLVFFLNFSVLFYIVFPIGLIIVAIWERIKHKR